MIAPEVTRSRFVQSPESGRESEPRPLGVGIAMLLVVFGIVGIFTNIMQVQALLSPVAGWPSLRLVPAIELTLLGAAFLSLIRFRRSTALLFAALASAVGLGGIFGALGAYTVPLGGIALSSAVLFTTLSIALLFAAASASSRDEERALGIGGFIVIALVGSILGATAIGVLDPMVDAKVAGSSLQTLLCSLALGGYLIGVLWTSGRVTIESADWLPAGVGFASVLTVLVLWRALTVREVTQLQTLTEQASEAQASAMSSAMQTLSLSVARAADRHADGATAVQESHDLAALEHDLRGLQGAHYVSVRNGLEPTDAAPGVEVVDSMWANRMRGRTLVDSVAYWPLDSAAHHIAVIAPVCTAGFCDGAIVGVVQTDTLFAAAANDTTLGFFHAVRRTKNLADSMRAEARRVGDALMIRSLQLGDVRLQLLTWPTRSTLSRVRSQLPTVVLTMGLLLSALLLLTTMLGQGARRVARTRERARLASVLERSTDGIWEWDLVSGTADHSAGIWRNLGYDATLFDAGNNGGGVATNRPTREQWLALVHHEDVDGFNRALQRHLNGDTDSFEHEYRVRSQNGDWHAMVDRARVVERAPTGQAMRLLGVRADVTEARNAQAARLMNERRFRAIFDSGFQYQLLLDLDGNVLEVNRVALEACSEVVGDVVGKPVWNTLWWAATPEARGALQQAFTSARAGTAARYEGEVHCEDCPTSTLEIALKPFLDRAGQTNQLLLEARDITVRRRAEAALQEVDTLTTMGRVAARVAHEINNPLAGIQNSFLLIKGAIPTTHPHFAYVGAIEREIDRIAAVTRQLYETYRPEQDLGAGTSVRSLVADAVSFLAQVNRGSHVRVETDFSNVPSVINLPSAMLRQIVYNLAQNAIEASPSGQMVSIHAGVSAGRFHLSVRDRGTGVPAELRDRIFDPFFSTKDRGVRTGGMGLGLALVRRTVTAAGGNISVQDAADGGSIFTVTLPVPSGAQGEDG
jgi:PAS domain S-box-containing protein